MLGNFASVLSSADVFQNHIFRKKIMNTIRESNSFDPDARPDLGSNCLQNLSADNTGRHTVKVGVVFRKVNY